MQTFLVAFAVLLRILVNPLGNVFQKKLTAAGNHPLLVNFLTYLLLSLACLPLLGGVDWRAFSTTFWVYAIVEGLAGALGNGFLVKALEKGELSVLGPINAYKSVVGVVVGIILLGELPGVWGLLGIALIVWGSYFVLGTTPERFSWALLRRPEIRYRIWAMVITAIEAVLIKKVILLSSVTVGFITWCVFGAVFSLFLLPAYRLSPLAMMRGIPRSHWPLYFYLVLCVGLMQFTTNYAFEKMPVGYALSLFQLSTLVSILLGYRIFRERDIRKKLLGAAIMVAGSVLIILLR